MASVGGVAFSLGVAAEADKSSSSSTALLRRISTTVKISSMEVCLDKQPFIQLLQRRGARVQARSFESEEQTHRWGLAEMPRALAVGRRNLADVFTPRKARDERRLEAGDGMQLRLVAAEKPSTPWDVSISLLGEPVQVGPETGACTFRPFAMTIAESPKPCRFSSPLGACTVLCAQRMMYGMPGGAVQIPKFRACWRTSKSRRLY